MNSEIRESNNNGALHLLTQVNSYQLDIDTREYVTQTATVRAGVRAIVHDN